MSRVESIAAAGLEFILRAAFVGAGVALASSVYAIVVWAVTR